MDEPPVSDALITIADMVDLRHKLHALVLASEMPVTTIEEIAGLPKGYLCKTIAGRPARGLSGNTVMLIANALGFALALAPDEAARKRVKSHAWYRVANANQRRHGEEHWRHTEALRMLKEFAQSTGKTGAAAMMAMTTPEQRSRSARKAIKARWRAVRRARRTTRRTSAPAITPP